MAVSLRRCNRWLWDDSDNRFPPIRILFLISASFFYCSDFFIDTFAAVEHYLAWRNGSDSSYSYFIATVVFVVLPTLFVNLFSLILYTWSYFVHNHKVLRQGYNGNFYSMYSENIRPLLWHRNKVKVQKSLDSNPTAEDIPMVAMTDDKSTTTSTGRGLLSRARQISFSKRAPTYDMPAKKGRNLETLAEEDESGTEEIDTTAQESGTDEIDAVPEFYPLDQISTRQFLLIILLHVCQVGFLYRVVRLFLRRTKDPYSFDRYRDLSFLRLMEAFLESAPQLLLQLYIVVVEDITDPVRKGVTAFAVVLAVFSLSLAIADYASAGKDILYYDPPPNRVRKPRLSWTGYILIILWNLGMTVSRGIAISLFASEYGYYVFILGVVHYCVMLYWLYRQDAFVIKTEYSDYKILGRKKICNNYGIEFIAALFNIFFLFKLFSGDSILYSTAYYVLFFTENIIMILLWYVHIDYTLELWYQEAAPVAVFFAFFAGLCFLLVYYLYFQPKDMPDLERDPNMEHPVMTCTLNRLYKKVKD